MKDAVNILQVREFVEHYQRYRASLLAANMIESGVSTEDILITRRKANIESVPHEIEHVSVKYPYLDPDHPYIEIGSGNKGIYDYITEGLFFIGDHSNKEYDKREIINRIKQDRESEQEIRRFMQLFEAESDQFLTHLNRIELQYDNALSYDSVCDFYAQYWETILIMRRDEAMRFIRAIPYFASIRGNLQEASKTMSYIMGVEVNIIRHSEIQSVHLGNQKSSPPRLGSNFVLKSDSGKRRVEIMLITVSGIDRLKCREFLKDRRGSTVLNFLCETLLDADIEFRIKIVPNVESRGFSFSKDEKNAYYLGINTYL
ncbi:MAG: hypothetical protein ACRCZQ_05195 [Bacteroidales bacterium]